MTEILILLLLILINALFVMTEMALVSVRKGRLEALKNKVPLTLVRLKMFDGEAPAPMSLTRTVPATVPSDFHSSCPIEPLFAVKNSVLLTLVRWRGSDAPDPA